MRIGKGGTSAAESSAVTEAKENIFLKEMITELKINNQYLLQIVGESNKINESDIEIGK